MSRSSASVEHVELWPDADGVLFNVQWRHPDGTGQTMTLDVTDVEKLVTAFAREGGRAQREFPGVLQAAVEAGVRELAAEATGR
jgi:hypothetical protein